MNAPRRHHPAALLNGLSDLLVVARTHRVARTPQFGRIGLQIHGGGKAEAWYKNIYVKELP